MRLVVYAGVQEVRAPVSLNVGFERTLPHLARPIDRLWITSAAPGCLGHNANMRMQGFLYFGRCWVLAGLL
jgi:hypothetical protein